MLAQKENLTLEYDVHTIPVVTESNTKTSRFPSETQLIKTDQRNIYYYYLLLFEKVIG